MGTKVQCESYYQGYSSMRDLNEEASSSCSLYHEDKTSNYHHHYNSYLPRPTTDGYSIYDKLRQTMLQQEETFRRQLYDLHLVYRRHVEWMDEVKRKERGKYIVTIEASRSSPLSSQMHTEDAQKTWLFPTLPSVDSGSTRLSASVTDNLKSSLAFVKASEMQTSPISVQNERTFLSEFKQKKLARNFDLQLPADEYIDSDEGEPIEKEEDTVVSGVTDYTLKKKCGCASESDLKLSLVRDAKPSFEGDASTSETFLRNRHHLADLNEPIQVEEATTPVPGTFSGQDLHKKQISTFLGLPMEFFQNTQKDKFTGPYLNTTHLENGEKRGDRLSSHFDAGQSSTNLNYSPQGSQKIWTPSASMQAEFRKVDPSAEYNSTHTKRKLWSGNAISSTEIFERSQSLSKCNYSDQVGSPFKPSPYPVFPQFDVNNSGYRSLPSWMTKSNFSQKQAVQVTETSAQYRSAIQSPRFVADKRHLNCDGKLETTIRNEATYQNGFYHCSQSHPNASQAQFPSTSFDILCNGASVSASERFVNQFSRRDVKSAMDMNLNLAHQNVAPQEVVIIDGEEEDEDQSGELLSLRADCNNGPPKANGFSNKGGLSFLKAYSHVLPHKTRTEEVPVSGYTPAYSLVNDPEKIEVGECSSSKKILGFPIFNKPFSEDPSFVTFSKRLRDPSEYQGCQSNVKKQVIDINVSQDPEIPESGKEQSKDDLITEKAHDKDILVSRKYINLNSPVEIVDEEEDPLVTNCLPRTRKIDSEIDLEVPALEESVSSALESTGDKVRPVHFSTTQTQETLNELSRFAAESIVLMSFPIVCDQSGIVSSLSSEESRSDPLHWFAEVALSDKINLDNEGPFVLKGKDHGQNQETPANEMDYFESMTLKLIETKEDEYLSTKSLWRSEDQNEGEKCASLSLTQRRKGQAKRGRQRKDFQRDILPGLASLSRYEVAEDLQTIGGLIRATGCSWQARATRRNSARNGCARGNKLSDVVSPILTTMPNLPSKVQPNNNVQGFNDRSLKGWGNTTRRPRRQRFPAGKAPIPLTLI